MAFPFDDQDPYAAMQADPFGPDPWDFLGGGGPPSAVRPPQGRTLQLPDRPRLADLIKPLLQPDYPLPPSAITSIQQLSPDDRRRVFQSQLANIAAAIGGGSRTGEVGTALAGAVGQNVNEIPQQVIAQANDQQDRNYARDRAIAQEKAARQLALAKQQQEENEARALLAVGDKAIELAGGADADQPFAARVYNAVQTKNASDLQALLKEGPARRAMREVYGIKNPDDPLGIEAFKAKQQQDIQTAGAVDREKQTDPIIRAREIATHQANRNYDLAHPEPKAPERARLAYDQERGLIVNMDTGTAAPIPGVAPRPRNNREFDQIETQAISLAAQDMKSYNENPNTPRDKNGAKVPFNFMQAYDVHEKQMRQIADRQKAAADPSSPVPGSSTKPVPGPGLQSPKGAPVGMGGNAGQSDAQKREAAAQAGLKTVESSIGALPPDARTKALALLRAGTSPDAIVTLYRSRKRPTAGPDFSDVNSQ